MITLNFSFLGMLVVKLGGPAYRIGVGGGSASSVEVQGKIFGCVFVFYLLLFILGDKNRCKSLDFGAVQRGDAEMEQKLNRVIRSCLEIGSDGNPIQSIHDQGAGGNGIKFSFFDGVSNFLRFLIHCPRRKCSERTRRKRWRHNFVR